MTPSAKAIPFYGATNQRLFEIERRCMDRDGIVIQFIDELLPHGCILDMGAGNGFTAGHITREGRLVVAMEPDPRMIDLNRPLLWARGIAQDMPFHDASFDAAYATWAYFLPGVADKARGLGELCRVVKAGGLIVIVDNAGDDEFSALSDKPISDNGAWYMHHGFRREVLVTSFRFDSVEEARELLSFYFGKRVGQNINTTEIGFRVAAYLGESGRIR